MSNWSTLTITDIGKTTASELIANKSAMTFSKLVAGDGTPNVEYASLTRLASPVKNISIASVSQTDETVTLGARITNSGNNAGFTFRELGVYIKDSNDNDILFGYMYDESPNYFPAQNIQVIDVPIKIVITLSAARTVTAVIDMEGYATLNDLREATLTFNDIYPVGAIYLSTVATSPATLFGGTWVALPSGRMLVAQGDGYGAGSTGGEAYHKLTIDEMPAHTHEVGGVGDHQHIAPFSENGTNYFGDYDSNLKYKGSNKTDYDNPLSYTSGAGGHTHNLGWTGGNGYHNNMPPWLSVYMWQRTA